LIIGEDTPLSNKAIEEWKAGLLKGKKVFVSAGVKKIHSVIDRIVHQLLEIDRIQYVRVSPSDIQAPSVISIKGTAKIPISTPSHPTAIGVHLIFEPAERRFNSTKSTQPRRGMEKKS
jgi:hypothetical protein